MRTLLLPFFSYSRLLPSFSAIDAKTIIVRVPLIQLLVCVRVYACIASRLVVENWFLFFSREVAWLLWSCETCRSTKQLEHVLVEDPAVFLLHSPKRHFFLSRRLIVISHFLGQWSLTTSFLGIFMRAHDYFHDTNFILNEILLLWKNMHFASYNFQRFIRKFSV